MPRVYGETKASHEMGRLDHALDGNPWMLAETSMSQT